MGDPLYLQHPINPDERDLVVRGVSRLAAPPAPSVTSFFNLLPNANYVFDPAIGFWVPQEQASSSLVVLLNAIAQATADGSETLESVIAGWLNLIKNQGVPPLVEARLAQAAALTGTSYTAQVVSNEYREMVIAGYNWLARYLNTGEVNPLSMQFFEQTLANAVSFGAGGTYYYPSANGALMAGFKDLSLEFILSANGAGDSITLTFEISQDTAAAPAAGSWVNVMLSGWDTGAGAAAAASYAAAGVGSTTTGIVDWDELNAKQFRVVLTVVRAVANLTATLHARQKAL